MKSLELIISGKVQGVFFRAETKKMADALGVKGFVKNESDGSVFVHAEGEEEMVHKLVDYCHHGPENAEVEKVSITLGEVINYTEFKIKR